MGRNKFRNGVPWLLDRCGRHVGGVLRPVLSPTSPIADEARFGRLRIRDAFKGVLTEYWLACEASG